MQRFLIRSLRSAIPQTFLRFRSSSKSKSTPVLDDKAVALKIALNQIESAFGKGAVMRLGDREHLDIPVISSGSLSLDRALGIKGFPRGRIIEIFGPESSGKTSLALLTVAEAQKNGGLCTFIDAEHALDPTYAEKLGVQVNDLYVSQPDSGEQALEIADSLVRSNTMDVIVIDSVAALVPKAEVEGSMGDQHMALQARLMSQALRKLTSSISKSHCVLIFINQIRQKVGVLFGNPEVTPGGNALKFYSSIRLDIRRKTQIKQGDDVIGYETNVKVVKNKMAPPFKVATFNMMFGEGIDKYDEVLNIAVEEGLLSKSGAWFRYNGTNFAQGRNAAVQYLKENPDLYDELHSSILKKWESDENNTENGNNIKVSTENVEEQNEEENK